jgi:transcription termination/antitermination protein NusG
MIDDKQIESSGESAEQLTQVTQVQAEPAQPVVEAASGEVTENTEESHSETSEAVSSDAVPASEKAELSPEEAAAEAERLEAEKKAHIPWYVVHVYSGFEGRVKLSLEERIRNASLQEKFGRIIVPQEKVVELVRGEKKTSTRKFFPGYILIQCELYDETWHLVKDTPKVTGFVGDSHNPMPLSPQEVQTLFEQMEGIGQKARPKVQFEDGDSVKVIDGPFADFNGTIDEVKADKGKVRVLISIFGRNTPVELDFVQVEKV